MTTFLLDRVEYMKHPVYGDCALCKHPDIISDAIRGGDVWERQLVECMVSKYKPDTGVLDVGGNMGFTAAGFLARRPDADCILFEPVPLFMSMAMYNLRNYPQVRFNAMALGSEACQLFSFRSDAWNCGFTQLQGVKDQGAEAAGILSTSLDAMEQAGVFVRPVSVMKCDVEGHEAQVLQGGRNLFFRRHRPALIIELWPTHYDSALPILSDLGYAQTAVLDCHNYLFESLFSP